jgi:hypothetical protein
MESFDQNDGATEACLDCKSHLPKHYPNNNPNDDDDDKHDNLTDMFHQKQGTYSGEESMDGYNP